MQILIKAMIGAAALAFLLAVVGTAIFHDEVLGIAPEAYSRASNNLALLAIASWFSLGGAAKGSGDS